MIGVGQAQAGEAQALTALCVRSKAHWGYDDAFMRSSRASLTVSDTDIASGRVLVATDTDRIVGVARVEPNGELGVMFVDPPAMDAARGGCCSPRRLRSRAVSARVPCRSSPIPTPRHSTSAWARASLRTHRPMPFPAAPCRSMNTTSRTRKTP